MEPDNLNTALIAAASSMLAGFLTWLGVRRKSGADEAVAFLKAGVDMQSLIMQAKNEIQQDMKSQMEDMQQSLARAENARRAAELARDQAIAQSESMAARFADLERRYVESERRYQAAEKRSAEYRRGYKKVLAALRESIGPEGLEEFSDLPEEL